MRLVVVGCSGSVPGPDSPASCYLLEADDDSGRTWRVVLDLGSGAGFPGLVLAILWASRPGAVVHLVESL